MTADGNRAGSSCSVVIPVFNGSESLGELAARLEPVLRQSFGRFEVILVNDGSSDASWPVIADLARRYPWITGIDLMRNYGQHNALLCGIQEATGELIVTMDDDLQHRPEDIPTLVAALDGETDLVYGTPVEEQHGLFRDFASQTTKLALRTSMGVKAASLVSPFRLFRTEIRQAFATCRQPRVTIDVLLSWGTSRLKGVAVPHEKRKHGTSNYSFRHLVRHAATMITGYSTLPLRLASLAAFLFMALGFVAFLFVILRALIYGRPVPGFAMLASLITILSGVQLFSLGILGEYIARMHVRMMDSPPYVVRTRVETGRDRR